MIDIRGTHGSGKSWLVRQLLLEEQEPIPCPNGGRPLGHIIPKWDAVVLGPYEKPTTGGCDAIRTVDVLQENLLKFHSEYRVVVLEGIFVSHTFKRYHELAERLGDYRFMFLNTPLRNCIARVRARRFSVGNRKELNTSNIERDYYNIFGVVRKKLVDAGHYVRVVDWKNPLPTIVEELEKT